MAEEKSYKIAVCMPLYYPIQPRIFVNLINFLTYPRKHKLMLFFTDATYITHARNKLVELFLQSDCEYMLFLDSDILVPKNIAEALLSFNKEVVSAMYYTRDDGKPMFRVYRDGNYYEPGEFPKNDIFEVGGVGLGCCLLKREVVEKVAKSVGDQTMFDVVYKNRNYAVGEDIFFSELIRKAGYKVWVATAVTVGHFGGIIDAAYAEAQKLKTQVEKGMQGAPK